MTLEELREKVRKWDFQHTGSAEAISEYGMILNQLEHHARREWRVYLPAEHFDFNASYMERLATWIGNVTDELDQKLMLQYALYISFISHDDFAALYRTALDREVSSWVVSQIGARLDSNGGQALNDLLTKEVQYHTWFCPVTDSMDINEFYKVNHLEGVAHRPGFATLQMLAEKAKTQDPALAENIIHYMSNPRRSAIAPGPELKRLVLLEDFVGTGTQCIEAIRWAAEKVRKPVLFVPLILCPNGAKALREIEQQFDGQLTVSPVIEIHRRDLLGPERMGQQGSPITEAVEALVRRFAKRVNAESAPFGFKDTGCSLVTFSNTPNNSIPMIHSRPKDGEWEPLFPRVFRD